MKVSDNHRPLCEELDLYCTSHPRGSQINPKRRATHLVNGLSHGRKSFTTRVIDKEHVNAILGSLGVPKDKIVKGIPHSCGILGCGLSHALAVAECIDSNATSCAIFEDDFELVRDPEEAKIAVERFFQSEPPSWEVLMLRAHAVMPSSPSPDFSHLDVINATLTASGYIIHRSFAPKILETFMEASYRLNESNCSQAEYAHDVLWKRLQQSGKWFALKPLVRKQRASYSDIEKRHVDYKVKLRL